MTLCRARRDPEGTKAAAQMPHRVDHRSAQGFDLFTVVANEIHALAASSHNCFAFVPQGYASLSVTMNPAYSCSREFRSFRRKYLTILDGSP
jgi:hypothetical protein